MATTYRIDRDTSASLIFKNILKRKVEDIDNFDCLKIKTNSGSSEETMKKICSFRYERTY